MLMQGAWQVTVRHGQATVQQLPVPRKIKPTATKYISGEEEDNPVATGVHMDGAQLRSLLTEKEVELPEVSKAIGRRMEQSKSRHWTKAFTTRVGGLVEATKLLGCDSLTWDPQFETFISPHAKDVRVGSAAFEEQLEKVGAG